MQTHKQELKTSATDLSDSASHHNPVGSRIRNHPTLVYRFPHLHTDFSRMGAPNSSRWFPLQKQL